MWWMVSIKAILRQQVMNFIAADWTTFDIWHHSLYESALPSQSMHASYGQGEGRIKEISQIVSEASLG